VSSIGERKSSMCCYVEENVIVASEELNSVVGLR
jgi:hypothetical protein